MEKHLDFDQYVIFNKTDTFATYLEFAPQLLKILNEAAYVLPLKMFNEHLCPLLKLLLN